MRALARAGSAARAIRARRPAWRRSTAFEQRYAVARDEVRDGDLRAELALLAGEDVAPALRGVEHGALPRAHGHDDEHVVAAQIGADPRTGLDRAVGAGERLGPPRAQRERAV